MAARSIFPYSRNVCQTIRSNESPAGPHDRSVTKCHLIPILPVKTVYHPTKLAPHRRRRRTDATLAMGMERARSRTETMIPEREQPPNADAPAGVVVGAQRAVSPRRSRRHGRSPADGAIRGGVGAEGGRDDVLRHRTGGRGHA